MWLMFEHISLVDKRNEHFLQNRISVWIFEKYKVSLNYARIVWAYINVISDLKKRLHNVLSSDKWNICILHDLLLNKAFVLQLCITMFLCIVVFKNLIKIMGLKLFINKNINNCLSDYSIKRKQIFFRSMKQSILNWLLKGIIISENDFLKYY